MLIKVIRDLQATQSTMSTIHVGNMLQLYGMEPPVAALRVGAYYAIPDGVYNLWLGWSNANRLWLPHLHQTGLVMDTCLLPFDRHITTTGDLLLGTGREENVLSGGIDAFMKLMNVLKIMIPQEQVTIAYITPEKESAQAA